MLSLRNVLLLMSGFVMLEISSVLCVEENTGEYGNQEELSDEEQAALETILAQIYRNGAYEQNIEDINDKYYQGLAQPAHYDDKRFSEFLGGKKRFSEFLGGKKRFSEFLGGKKRFSEFLGGKKRFSEFLGGKKRFSEFLGGKKRFSEFLGGKRSSRSLPEKRDFDFLGGR